MNRKNKLNFINIKTLMLKIKWIFAQSKSAIPFLLIAIFINTVLASLDVYNTIVSKSLIDCATNGEKSQLLKWLIIMALIMISNLITNPIISMINTHASIKLTQDLQKKLYNHIQYSDWLSQSKFHSVNLLSRVTSDVNTISSMLLNTIPLTVTLIITLIGSFSTLIFLAPSIAIIAIIIGPILIIIGKVIGRNLKQLYKKSQEEDIKYRTFIQESFQNILIVKSFCMEKLNLNKLSEIQKNKYKIAIKNTKISSFSGLSMGFCSTLAYFSIFSWGVVNISKGTSTYGTFAAMLQLYSKIQYPISSLANTFPDFISAIAACERLMEIESIPLEEELESDMPVNINKAAVSFNNVSFEYIPNKPVLHDLNLTIYSGEIIGLIGRSGEGKTTLIRLLLSLIKPTCGTITLFENNSYKSFKLDKNYRSIISYVPQGNTLFSGTIEENLRYGNTYASESMIYECLKKACALNFVNELSNGLNTIIGERGVGISEGQAQRISIARAFLRKKPILILDEATSALDPETEIKVLHEIKSLSHKPTCIIITHRPSALNICNRIFKLKKGAINEINKSALLEAANELI